MDAGAAIVMTGLLFLLARHPYNEWESLANEHALLFIVTGVLATLFFLFSFFGELITKILELKAGTIKQENGKSQESATPATPTEPTANPSRWATAEEVKRWGKQPLTPGLAWAIGPHGFYAPQNDGSAPIQYPATQTPPPAPRAEPNYHP